MPVPRARETSFGRGGFRVAHAQNRRIASNSLTFKQETPISSLPSMNGRWHPGRVSDPFDRAVALPGLHRYPFQAQITRGIHRNRRGIGLLRLVPIAWASTILKEDHFD